MVSEMKVPRRSATPRAWDVVLICDDVSFLADAAASWLVVAMARK